MTGSTDELAKSYKVIRLVLMRHRRYDAAMRLSGAACD